MGKTRDTGNLVDNNSGTNTGDQSLAAYQLKSLAAYSLIANNTSGTADGTANVYKEIAEQTYAGTVTPTAGLAPSGTQTHTYSWMQIGNSVFLRMNLKWSVAGTTVTQLSMPMPTDMPAAKIPAGYTGANAFLYKCQAHVLTNITTAGVSGATFITRNSGDNGFNLVVTFTTSTMTACIIEIFYLTT